VVLEAVVMVVREELPLLMELQIEEAAAEEEETPPQEAALVVRVS
jgi:GTPase Era involved in 16S rRNA processing